jgi:hypothetical protein
MDESQGTLTDQEIVTTPLSGAVRDVLGDADQDDMDTDTDDADVDDTDDTDTEDQ